ncbi:MAG TPA: hypothetical protein VFM15_06885 [Gammaproteobacteria bacterium]|nr:hypothetical protein [Gammaproteobacteria bacterium]
MTYQKKVKKMMLDRDRDVDFYGKVVDQDGRAVAGAQILNRFPTRGRDTEFGLDTGVRWYD